MVNTSDGFHNYLIVEVVTKNNELRRGMRVNEDAFSIQIRDINNQLLSYSKKDIQSIKKLYEQSFMPTVKGVLNDNEIDHLVAFLSNQK